MFRIKPKTLKRHIKRLVYKPVAEKNILDFESGFTFPETIVRVRYEDFGK